MSTSNNLSKTASSYLLPLDGVRTVALLMVVASHFGLGHIIPGGVGLNSFFFISGFLITRLLIAEHNRTGTINLKNFYIRRFLRLYPALLFMLLVSVVFIWAIGCTIHPQEILSSLFYYRNYFMIYMRPIQNLDCTLLLDIQWSLAIEEHFYIVFPLLFVLLFRFRTLFLIVLTGGIVGILAWRLYLMMTYGPTELTIYTIYHLTETRADAIMYGCLVGLLVHGPAASTFIRKVNHPVSITIAIALMIISLVYRDQAFRETFRYSFQGIGFSILIPVLLYNPHLDRLRQLSSTPWLLTVAQLSYSIYLFHWIGISIARYITGSEQITFQYLMIAIPSGLTLSLISYYGIEKRILKFRKQYGANLKPDTATTPQPTLNSQPISG
ncbi:acyltransferase family protein [Larkinella terrae]|uniref:Acyltransferase family protein n=1 Tax=Larkinella terrae TaxID=2025311 RepID=A0A7K0EUP1_9BACT|nr:acyltransferase [Larkinella terrae]MRS65535.1 acyltransferase family protein [Larkinella terrae]